MKSPITRTSGLMRIRSVSAPVAATTLFFFLESAIAPAVAWAAPSEVQRHTLEKTAETSGAHASADPAANLRLAEKVAETAQQEEPEAKSPDVRGAGLKPSAPSPGASKGRAAAPIADLEKASAAAADRAPEAAGAAAPEQALALPTGTDKTGVTSNAISLPQGSGKVQGMGESFSAQLSTGIASYSVPFTLPTARGLAQPALGLGYSSAGGAGVAGLGWDVGVAFIARQTDRGLPTYDDRPGFHANQDHFVMNGGQELVPICVITAGACAGAPGEIMPAWAEGSQYFRARVEGSFQRFFWSIDHRTWRVQDKSGTTMELGVPLDGTNDTDALVVNPDDPAQIYRWHLVREYDMQGGANPAAPPLLPTPNNVVLFRYSQAGGMAYLSDIYDTTPKASPTTLDSSVYAHHTHLSYESRTDPTTSYRSGWRISQSLRLTGVDVASKTFNDAVTAPRHQVRRYHLAYRTGHVSLLESVQMEGRCTSAEASAPAEDSGVALPAKTNCESTPALTFGYSHVATNADLPGFEGFDEALQTIQSSPPHSVDEDLTDLLDVNSDGLIDVLNTSIGTYGNGHGVFFNSVGGVANSFGGAQLMTVDGVLGATANSITFENLNLAPLDLDGDGTLDLLHMPQAKTYSTYSPVFVNGGWVWRGRAISTASAQNPKIDFGRDSQNTRVVDINGDGLVDVLVSTGTEYQSFLALGRLPQGDGQFGYGLWATAKSGSLSNDPVRACVPWASSPVQLNDPDVSLADMNGDGFADLVRRRRGDIRYWPGRGNGTWGTGSFASCQPGTFSSNAYVQMNGSPLFSDIQGASLRMDDVNGDGLDDLVQVRYDAVDIWLNVDGQGWTDRHIITNTPKSPAFARRVRLVDVNGSGTRDILWANAENYQYIDLAGGQRPWLLTRVVNGLGRSTDIEYSTSTAEMLAAESLPHCDPSVPSDAQLLATSPWACAWVTKMPVVAHVLKRVTDSDNLSVAGQGPTKYVTEYQYRDPVFEGRQREFRGFARARSKTLGDVNSPTSFTDTSFLLGECEDETPSDSVADCALSERWRDNPREALKGLPVFTERYDEKGTFLGTQSNVYRLRQLFTGLDGRVVRQAFPSGSRAISYDTAAGPQSVVSAPSSTVVELESASPTSAWDPIANQVQNPGKPATGAVFSASRTALIPLRASGGFAVMTTASEVDSVGNRLVDLEFGCTAGSACPAATAGIAIDETIAQVTKPALVDRGKTGWLWRTVESWTTGSVHKDTRSHHFVSYDTYGQPLSTTAELRGVVALDRFTAVAANGTAPLPATRSSNNSVVLLAANTYNAFGQPIQTTGALSRCRDVSYASDMFSSFLTGETIHTSGGCASSGLAALTASASYDRGFAVVTLATDLQLQPTKVVYDSLARLSEVYRSGPNTNGVPATVASVRLSYSLPSAANPVNYSVIHTQTQDGASNADASYLDSYVYYDGFSRSRIELDEADKAANDSGAFIAVDIETYDAKGAVSRRYLPYFTDLDPAQFPIASAPPSAFGRERFDAFGRQLQVFDLDGTVTSQTVYHALSSDVSDAADLQPGPHQGTFASSRSDGHGRTIATTERIHSGAGIEAREVRSQYLTTGEVEVITRVRVNAADPAVVRWMGYDSLGHLVLNVDPNTSANFNASPGTDATPSTNGLKAWRYAYDDAGEMVGTSDARGCGQNLMYDGAGRLLGEDYSPCGAPGQAAYTAPTLVNGANGPSGYEVLNRYDSAPQYPFPETTKIVRPASFATSVDGNGASPYLRGRLVTVWSQGKAEWDSYDGRGRVIQSAVLPALPVDPVARISPSLLSQRYGQRFYSRDFKFDAADRELSATTGSSVPQLQGTANASMPSGAATSAVVTEYSKRGTVKAVHSTYGDLVTSITRSADGLATEIIYGDAAGTRTDTDYDTRRRLRNVQTYRGPPSIWSSPPANYTPAPAPNGAASSFQMVLQDEQVTYDVVGNPTEVRDYRTPQEWPAGSKPTTKRVQYDDLYRVTRIDYESSGGSDPWTSPFAAELSGLSDARRAVPAPHVKFDSRPLFQAFAYDWLGNTSASDDDTHGFYDRSLGAITNDTGAGHPYQLKAASNKAGPATTRSGTVGVRYDAMGNVDRINLERNGGCLPTSSPCSSRMDLQYDEVGRLSRVFRLDLPTASLPPLSTNTTAHSTRDLQFLYDEDDERIVKISSDVNNVESSTLYPHESLEVRGTALDPAIVAYSETQLTADNEVPYLNAIGVRLARLDYEKTATGEPRVGTANPGLHVFLELQDSLGSNSLVIDKASSELVESSTFQGYGAQENDYRPDRWKGFRNDYGFTGNESDVEFGLTYFGKRFYAQYLNRWITPDPLAVHSPGEADLNLYAYVHGTVLSSVDAVGLYDSPSGNMHVGTDLIGDTVDSNGVHTYIFGDASPQGEPATKPPDPPPSTAAFPDVPHEGPKSPNPSSVGRTPGISAGVAPIGQQKPGGAPGGTADTEPDWLDNLTVIAGILGFDPHIMDEPPPVRSAHGIPGGEGGDSGRFGQVAYIILNLFDYVQSAASHAAQLIEQRAANKAAMIFEEIGTHLPWGGGCFAGGTLVSTDHGLVPIELVKVGDLVLSRNQYTGRDEYRRVLNTSVRADEPVQELLVVNGVGVERFVSTFEHPFATGEQWVAADQLPYGLLIDSASGVASRSLVHAPLAETTTVYNIEVEGNHDYFIGRGMLLVHNASLSGLGGKGGESAKAARGRAAHEEFKVKVKSKPGWKSEPRGLVDPKTGKAVIPDALTPHGNPVELKPDTPSGRKAGKSQIKKYERATGKKGKVVYYNP